MAVCAAPVTVAADPLALPVTLPVNAPTKAVDVMEVAPVTTPASTLIVPSRTIAEPSAGVRLRAPVVAVIVFPSTVKLSIIAEPAVRELVPILIVPKPFAIEPEARAPVEVKPVIVVILF